ncbi:MAG: class I SAM-dependent methyltransferase [Cyanobacteriota bacterium]|nr:class I SAM-dependent methyltransferase [Cyanobacteriota bacterium]
MSTISAASLTSVIPAPHFTSRLVSSLLGVKPLFQFAKNKARAMMIERAALIGVDWQQEAVALRSRGEAEVFSPLWEQALAHIQNPNLVYPAYYVQPFHAYEQGNLGWDPAMEVEVAALAVHSRVWGQQADPQGDARLRHSYHQLLCGSLPTPPERILDIGCSVGMSTFALQDCYPRAELIGLDLSPYFLAVAQYRAQQQGRAVRWIHAAAETTGLPDQSVDLVSAFLIFHELPQSATLAILQEARRILKPAGSLALMDMDPSSAVYARMPPYLLTLLKSTEPYLDHYFTLDLEATLIQAGFQTPVVTANSPRHRTVIAQRD